jgi:spatacsin
MLTSKQSIKKRCLAKKKEQSISQIIVSCQAMEKLAMKCGEGRGRALIRRIIAVVQTAKILGLSFSEAFEKQPIELLQLLSLKAQDSFNEAKFLVETHIMPASSIARILADSFLKVYVYCTSIY